MKQINDQPTPAVTNDVEAGGDSALPPLTLPGRDAWPINHAQSPALGVKPHRALVSNRTSKTSRRRLKCVATAEPVDPNPIPLRILLIEDEMAHCELVKSCLENPQDEAVQSMEVDCVHSLQHAMLVLSRSRYDCVLLDHNLPDGVGTELLEQLEADLLTTPVVGLSTSRDPDVALGDFRGGCIEFVCKHDAFRAGVLRERILSSMATFHRRRAAILLEHGGGVTSSHKALAEAGKLDPLTGICNQVVFADHRAELHERARNQQTCYGLVLIDVDCFREYNDQYGHIAGDGVLRSIAKAMLPGLRDDDFIARCGGQEFAVLLPHSIQQDIPTAAERLRHHVAALGLPHDRNLPHKRVTVSVGAAVFDPQVAETQANIYRRAEQALLLAKAAGRNRVSIAPPQRKARPSHD